ncbi:response regulator transcription factor [Sphingobacteriaceae bacterium WQ 2009]|uniref:Response regulator transcription factor n=1 Tax=Rhinopithecimicrobium faecis TaxID=2820698 RepID=A0A8T4HB38_9SPHI|nr:response regulator transcription factor [Sphingobacteriaceae bacterium WQ 2009]
MTQILLIEDDARVSELIQRGLREQGYDCMVAYDGEAGLKLTERYTYQLIITDLILPIMDGLAFCKNIRARQPEIPLIMLTALGTTDDKVAGFEAGADDYLVKPFEMRELIVRIRALLKRFESRRPNQGFMLSYADLSLNQHTKMVHRNGQAISLTPKEFKLLEFMLLHPERVLSRTEIAEKVWETHFDTGTNFIDVYINYLRKKVDRNFSEKLIHTQAGMGFVLRQAVAPIG